MKKILITFGFIIIVLIGCSKKEVLNFKDTSDVKNIIDNKSSIVKAIVRKTTIGSRNCYNVPVNDAYDAITNMKILDKSNISVTDDYMSYIFEFDNGTKQYFSFEGDFYVYNKENYEVDFKQLDLNEDDMYECD